MKLTIIVIINISIILFFSCTSYISKNSDNLGLGIKGINRAPVISFPSIQNNSLTVYGSFNISAYIEDDGLPNPPGKVTVSWQQLSGASNTSFSQPLSKSTKIQFQDKAYGTYKFKITANDGLKQSSYSFDVIYKDPSSQTNQAPTVQVFGEKSVIIPNKLNLSASVVDDGLPIPHILTYKWLKKSGPGEVTFNNLNSLETQITFNAKGTYTIELQVSDGELTGSDAIIIDVYEAVVGPNTAPTVDAGEGGEVELSKNFKLMGVVSDDGKPYGKLNITWSQQSGPGTASFSDINSAKTEVSFSELGNYSLKLTASDGQYSVSDNVSVTAIKDAQIPTSTPAAVVVDELVRQQVMDTTRVARWKKLFKLENEDQIKSTMVEAWYKKLKIFLDKYHYPTTAATTNRIIGCDQEADAKRLKWNELNPANQIGDGYYQFIFDPIKYAGDEKYGNAIHGMWRNRKNFGTYYRLEWKDANKTDVLQQAYKQSQGFGGKLYSYGFMLELMDFLYEYKGADPVVQDFVEFMRAATWQFSTFFQENKWNRIIETHYGKQITVGWSIKENPHTHFLEHPGEGMPAYVEITTPAQRRDPKNLYKIWPPKSIVRCVKVETSSGPEFRMEENPNGGDSDTTRHSMDIKGNMARAATHKLLGGYDQNLQNKLIFLLEGVPIGEAGFYSGVAKKFLSTSVYGLLDVKQWVREQVSRYMMKHFFTRMYMLALIVKYLEPLAEKTTLAIRARITIREILDELINHVEYKPVMRVGLEGKKFYYPWISTHPAIVGDEYIWQYSYLDHDGKKRYSVAHGGFWDWTWKIALITLLEILDENNPQEANAVKYLKQTIRQSADRITYRKYSPLAYEWGLDANKNTTKTPIMTLTSINSQQVQWQAASAHGGYLGHWSKNDIDNKKVLLRRYYSPQYWPEKERNYTAEDNSPRYTGGGLWPYEHFDLLPLAQHDIGERFIKEYFENRANNTAVTCLQLTEEIYPYPAASMLPYPDDHPYAGQTYCVDSSSRKEKSCKEGGIPVYVWGNTPVYTDKGRNHLAFTSTPRDNEGEPVELLLKGIIDKDSNAINTWMFISACRLLGDYSQLHVRSLKDFDNLSYVPRNLHDSPMDVRSEFYKLHLFRALFAKQRGEFGDSLYKIMEANK